MTVLLIIIYFSFISLGLPDSLLGSAWPVMHESFGVAISSAGAVSMIVSMGTIISSLFSVRLIRKFGTGPVTAISVAMTAAALLGISAANSLAAVCLCAVPLGLGAGSVDAGLNNFVALHYKATHMNWLHGFWGLGTIVGPVLISAILTRAGTWATAYRAISAVQFTLAILLVVSLPLWKKAKSAAQSEPELPKAQRGLLQSIKLPKAKYAMASFFCYCSLEQTVILWGSSYLVVVRGAAEDAAAGWISLYFAGITLGRFLSGALSVKFTQKQLILYGQLLMGAGILLLLLPVPNAAAAAGLLCLGIGCAPIFPCLLHETPSTFGKAHSQALMGIQMASAYVGTTFMPPLFGLASGKLGYRWFPLYLTALFALMCLSIAMIYTKRGKRRSPQPEN